MNLNKAIIIGNITRDPELRATETGTKVCSFGVATNEFYKDKDGIRQQRAEFHNVIAWGKLGENIHLYMKKGSQIMVEGKLQTRSWEADGHKNYKTEIVALNVQFGNSSDGKTEKKEEDLYDMIPEEERGITVNDIPF